MKFGTVRVICVRRDPHERRDANVWDRQSHASPLSVRALVFGFYIHCPVSSRGVLRMRDSSEKQT
jgi:hypothetical protein